MSIKMNLWSLTLLPGEKYPMLIPRDFQITNCALGEELRNETGRSVVKVTHNPIPPSAFEDDDSEFDSEMDSEIEDELRDEFELDEDDEEDDDEEEEEAPKAKKVNGHIAGELVDDDEDDEDDDEDEDDEDEDEEDDSEFSDDEEEALETNVMCSLIAGKVEQTTLNLTFIEGEVVMFEVTGENAVHLMGNYIDQAPDEDDSEYDSEYDDYSEIYGSEDDSDLDDLDIDGPTIEEIDELPKALKAEAAPKKAKAAPVEAKPSAVKAEKRKAEDAADVSMASSAEGLSKNQKKKLAKKQKIDAAAAPAEIKKEAKPQVTSAKAQKKVLPGGLVIEDSKVGDGPLAKKGKRLGMRYIGKLESGKQFDANTSGKPFSFVLGRGEVIKGWDQGLEGMAVGGERKLTIPAALAYGSQKIPGIPKNSTLKFEVKLVSVA